MQKIRCCRNDSAPNLLLSFCPASSWPLTYILCVTCTLPQTAPAAPVFCNHNSPENSSGTFRHFAERLFLASSVDWTPVPCFMFVSRWHLFSVLQLPLEATATWNMSPAPYLHSLVLIMTPVSDVTHASLSFPCLTLHMFRVSRLSQDTCHQVTPSVSMWHVTPILRILTRAHLFLAPCPNTRDRVSHTFLANPK